MNACYRASDVMQILGVSKPTVYKIIDAPDFPKIHIGRDIRIPVGPFEEWLNRQAEAGTDVLGRG